MFITYPTPVNALACRNKSRDECMASFHWDVLVDSINITDHSSEAVQVFSANACGIVFGKISGHG
jgi:hypothetical protein